jgi:uncharacterized protein YndB with AHSA1/START domain
MPQRLVSTEDQSSTPEDRTPVEPIRRSIRVKATPQRAFTVFTTEMDSWWPRTHHIGNSPMQQVVVEGRAGGRIYTVQQDGIDCPWAQVVHWEPPHRFVFAWQVGPDWRYVEDVSQCSEVEVTFTPGDDGTTLVELEHRNFHRHGGAYRQMREQVGAEGGWGGLLQLFGKVVEAQQAQGVAEAGA